MFDFLATRNIARVVDELVDLRQYTTDFRWLSRVPIVPSTDGEILARYKGRIYAADILTLDGKAVIRPMSPVRLQQTEIPVYKHGIGFTREMLMLINRIETNMASSADRGAFADWIGNNMMLLIDGVYTRMEAVAMGMVMDGMSYNRLGVVMDNVTWGMPSDLKITLTGAQKWTPANAATATPVSDILGVNNTASQKYGWKYDRVSMSTTTFLNMIGTVEFQTKAQGLYQVNQVVVFPLQNVEMMLPTAQKVLGVKEIEIDDRAFFTVDNAGTEGTTRFLPDGKVILSNISMDGNTQCWDFANAQCEEAMPGMVPSMIGGVEEGTDGYGPFGYVTAADSQGNPPGLNQFAVAKGFPRKFKEAASAVLTVY